MKRTPLLFLLVAMQAFLLPGLCFSQVEKMVGKVHFFKSSDTDKVVFDIIPTFNGIPLKLNQPYVNEHGDTLSIDLFRFYMTNISLAGNHNPQNINSHLYDLADSNTHSFILKGLPSGRYTSIQFTLGVDSIANTNGANDGDLDPVNGMYWAWNSGYIMAKLEGHSKVCKTLHHAFEFHIGGYLPPYNTARPIALKLPLSFVLGKPGIPCITLKVDVATWFTGNLDLSKVNDIVIPGNDASLMADKYAKMFSIDTVEYLKCLYK